MSEKKPSDSLQHIQFEGCDVCVIAPEDYDALVAALALHKTWEALLTDRGGKNGPKGRAYAAFIAARDAALKSSRGDL